MMDSHVLAAEAQWFGSRYVMGSDVAAAGMTDYEVLIQIGECVEWFPRPRRDAKLKSKGQRKHLRRTKAAKRG